MENLTESKAAARRAGFERRKAAHEAGGDGAAQAHLRAALSDQAGKVLAGYMPMRSEIDPLPVMAGHEGPVCVPVIMGKGEVLRFRYWSAQAPMVEGTFGAKIPEAGDWLVPQVLIVPMVAFDDQGNRLGYGGGFYDRTLAGLRAAGDVLALGFAYAAQQLDNLPLEPTDQKLDAVVTEQGIRWFR